MDTVARITALSELLKPSETNEQESDEVCLWLVLFNIYLGGQN